MRAFAKAVIRIVFILSIIALFFGVAVPQVLGMGWPKSLGRSTRPVHSFRLVQVMPGDTFSETLRFHNRGSRPQRYRLVVVRLGSLWQCDAGGNSLYYELAWSPGADQYLKAGETETVTVTVAFPQAASNSCQNKRGWLVVRRGYLRKGRGGVYECRPSPYTRTSDIGPPEGADLKGYICGRVDQPFLDLIYPKPHR